MTSRKKDNSNFFKLSLRAYISGGVVASLFLIALLLFCVAFWQYRGDATYKAHKTISVLENDLSKLETELLLKTELSDFNRLKERKAFSTVYGDYQYVIGEKNRKDIFYSIIDHNLDKKSLSSKRLSDDKNVFNTFKIGHISGPDDIKKRRIILLDQLPETIENLSGAGKKNIAFLILKKDQLYNDKAVLILFNAHELFIEVLSDNDISAQNITITSPNDVTIFSQETITSQLALFNFSQKHNLSFSLGEQKLNASMMILPNKIFFLLMCCGLFFLVAALIGLFLSKRVVLNDGRTAMAAKKHKENLASTLSDRLAKLERDFINLKKSEAEYRNLLDSISDIIFETDEDSEIVFLNDRWNRLTNIESWRVIGQKLEALFHEKDRESVNHLFEDYVSGKRLHTKINVQLKISNGKYKTVELQFSMIRIPGDQKIRIVGGMRDIEERIQSEQALREAESKYRSMVEQSLGGIYRSSPEGRFISANPAMAKILGYDSPEEFMAAIKDIKTDFYADQTVRKDLLNEINENDGATDLEARVLKKNGDAIWVSETCRPVKDDKGNLLFYEGTMVDISKRKETEEQLVAAKTQSDMSNRAKSEFLANMSHELRTPLNAIIGFSEILRDELFGPLGQEEYKEYAKDINNSGVHLLQIINDILDVSKIEAGKRELSETLMSLREVSESAFTMVKPKADVASIYIDNLIPSDLPPMRAEELAIKQILINLLNNAVKFTNEGGKITMNAKFEDEFLVVSVSDTGIGMKKEHIKKALSAFGQVNTAMNRKESGTGLGLTLVKQLTELHGGYISIDSIPDEGTTVMVYLPKWRLEDK